MKHRIAALIGFTLIITGCNLPTRQQSSPTPDFIATQVATMLTAQPTPQQVVDTPALAATPTSTETATSLPSDTPTASATATVSPEDPRVLLGNPSIIDTLDNGKSFGLDSKAYDDDYTYIRVENGALMLTSRYTIGFRGWRTGGAKLGDAYLEAPFRVGECAGSDTYGLVFRSPDFLKGYWFLVTCSGNWDLGYWDGSEYSSLGSGTNASNAFVTGSNQTNRLGVWADGNQIKAYINGKLITQIEDSKLTEPGNFGAVIYSYNTPNLTVSIDEFAYWIMD